jgi:hypothetical protein
MRKLLLLPLILWACGGSKEPKTEMPAAPAALTAAQVTGTYSGATTVPADSTRNSTWTAWIMADSMGGLSGRIVTSAAPTDTISFTQTLSGDSTINVSAPFNAPGAAAGSPQMTWRSIGHTSDGTSWTGTVAWMNAGSDSVTMTGTWTATRTP